MTNETGIERVFYIYNLSGCSCLWPYFHPPLLYTELCEVLWVPKLHRFPNKAGLCPGGTSWGLFRSSIGPTRRERPRALWFWQLFSKLVLEAISAQLHAQLALGCISMAPIHHLQPRPYGCCYTLGFLYLSTSMLSWAAPSGTYVTDTEVPGKSKLSQQSLTDCYSLVARNETKYSNFIQKNPLEATAHPVLLALRRGRGCVGI